MHKKLALSLLILLTLTIPTYGAKADSPVQPIDQDAGAATSFPADCICDQGNNYLNAYSYHIPLRPENYKVGTVITISANHCEQLTACKVRALIGTYRMKIDSWNSNTAYVYKFAINGPLQ